MTGAMMLLMVPIRWLAGPLAALAVGISACGGGGGDGDGGGSAQRPAPTATASTEGEGGAAPAPAEEQTAKEKPVDPRKERIVRAWADTLRRGDVRAAARYFALPSLVSNGTPPIRLQTRAEARSFNRSLPCGAEVIATERGPRGFVVVTFRLTERPGAGECGTGVGATARTAFRIRKEHITDWVRVPDPPPDAEAENVA
jgi:hypothetical protein